MGIKKQSATVALIWLLTMLFVSHAAIAVSRAGMMTTVTTGNREIVNGDVPQARQAAVSDALELAVVNAFSQTVSPQVFASHLGFLYEQVLPAAQDYVVTYRVLGAADHKDRYLVGVESRINMGLLEQTLTDAGILNIGTDKPAILFLIAEKTPNDLLPRYWWGNNPEPYVSHAEKKIIEIMKDSRFKIAGMELERPDPGFYDIRFHSIYDTAAAMDLAQKLHADMVVLGRAGAQESKNRMGDEKIFDAVITLTAFDLDSGQKVVVSENQASAKNNLDQDGSIQAIITAAKLAGTDLAEKLDQFWTRNLRKENHFDIQIEGNGFLPRFIALKKRLAQIPEIENLQPKEIGSDRAVMEVVYKGTPSHFADSIMLKTFDGFGIEIGEITDRFVHIRFIDDSRNVMTGDDAAVMEESIETKTE
jgi:hypothetical protein